MRAVVQRVSAASVEVDGSVVGAIDSGLAVLVGVAPEDTPEDAEALAAKIVGLRIFRDDADKMNRAVSEVGGGVLVVSQFTLYGNVRKGRRPSFVAAAPPDVAEPLVARVADAIAAHGIPTATGEFGGDMRLSLVNDGPVTLVLEVADGRVL